MKITLQRDFLLQKLTLASHFTSDKLSSSILLQGILLKSNGKNIHIYSTSLNTFYHTSIELKTDTFQLVVDPRKIIEFLNFLNPGEIEIFISEKQITINQDKTKGNFPLMVAEEFPMAPEIKEEDQKIESEFLLKNLPLLLFSASTDDSRPVLTGINFVHSDGELLMVATDGFRLSLIKEKSKGEIPSMIIPGDFLQEVLRNGKDAKEVQFAFSSEERIVRFRIENDEFYSRLIEGEFPPFEKVLLTESKTKVTVDKAEFLRNVKLISIFAREFSNVVICEFKKDGLYLRPKREGNEENSAFQEITIEGEEQKVAFNYKFLADLLNHVEDKDIHMEILRSDAPVAFRTDKNKAFLHIIMPVRIQE